MDLNDRMLTLEMDHFNLYEIFLHEISKKIKEGNNKAIFDQVKNGVEIRFDFEDVMKERFKRKVFIKLKNGKEVGEDIVKIIIGKREILEIDFDDEMLDRARLMRGWLWENMIIEKIGDWRKSEEDEN